MPKSFVAAVAVAAILLSACGGERSAPIEAVTPTPWPGDVVSSTPTATPTPSQEELSAEAERVYRTFFEEWKRLERAGGADEPTQIMRDTADGEYLEAAVATLREQKRVRITVTGIATTRVRWAPEEVQYDGIDSRLTLKVCEDMSDGTITLDGVTRPGDTVQGTVYLAFIGDRAKVVSATTESVERCSI